MDKQPILKERVQTAQFFIRMLEISIDKSDSHCALNDLRLVQKELDDIRQKIEASIEVNAIKLELLE